MKKEFRLKYCNFSLIIFAVSYLIIISTTKDVFTLVAISTICLMLFMLEIIKLAAEK